MLRHKQMLQPTVGQVGAVTGFNLLVRFILRFDSCFHSCFVDSDVSFKHNGIIRQVPIFPSVILNGEGGNKILNICLEFSKSQCFKLTTLFSKYG